MCQGVHQAINFLVIIFQWKFAIHNYSKNSVKRPPLDCTGDSFLLLISGFFYKNDEISELWVKSLFLIRFWDLIRIASARWKYSLGLDCNFPDIKDFKEVEGSNLKSIFETREKDLRFEWWVVNGFNYDVTNSFRGSVILR